MYQTIFVLITQSYILSSWQDGAKQCKTEFKKSVFIETLQSKINKTNHVAGALGFKQVGGQAEEQPE